MSKTSASPPAGGGNTPRPVEHEVAFENAAGLVIRGTLVVPSGAGSFAAVLIIPGSGRLDRDSNIGSLRMNMGTMATAFAQRGIASLRFDRRGIGCSDGNWFSTGFFDNRDDALAGLQYLRSRPEVRANAIGVVGHSEGGLHTLWLASHANINAAVLLATPARSGRDALVWQGKRIRGTLPKIARPMFPLMRTIASRTLARIEATTTDSARINGRRMNVRWYRELLNYNPLEDLAAISAPVLAITGTKDLQVSTDDLEIFARVIPTHTEIDAAVNLTHLLRRDTQNPRLTSYRRLLKHPIDHDLVDKVANWLDSVLGEKPRSREK
jgi:uncharacterized protein